MTQMCGLAFEPPCGCQADPFFEEEIAMNVLKASAICAEIAILGATTTVAWRLVADSGDIRIAGPIVAAAAAVELVRLPLALRVPKLKLGAAIGALTLAIGLSVLTGETLALGVDALLNARSSAVAAAETKLAEAQTSYDAVKADAARRDREHEQLVAAVATAQAHSEEIGRETVPLQANPSVSAFKTKKGWAAPGTGAANAAANANAKAQADHAARATAAETALASARDTLAALKPVDVKAEETGLTAAKQAVERERAANPMSRLAASIYRVSTSDLRDEDYQAVRRFVTLSLAGLMAGGTLAAGLISALPERGSRPGRVANAIRLWVARKRKSVVRVVEIPGPERIVEVDKILRVPGPETIKIKWMAYDVATGRRVKPDGSLGDAIPNRMAAE
jgi:hypothetical protein